MHNNDVVRLHTVASILTWAAACGSAPSVPKAPPPEPPIAAPPAQPAPVDAAVHDAAEPPAAMRPAPRTPPQLACEPGTAQSAAPAPEPTWYCARPDGTRHGPFVTVFPDGSPQITGHYHDGQLDGGWQRRAVTGAVVEVGAYAAGHKSGPWQMLSTAGSLLGEYTMQAGTGTEKHWLDDGSLYSERQLRASVLHGPERIYGPDGTALVASHWTAGKLDGARAIGSRATLRIEEAFVAGVRRGSRQIWLGGHPLLDASYDRQGRLHGDYVLWRNRRVMRLRGRYDHGKREGLWTWRDRGGSKEREGSYLAGKRDGLWTEWIENKIVWSGAYSRGRPDGEFIVYDRSENELGRFQIAGGTGTMLTFWPSKKIATRQRLVRGVATGPYQELTASGKLVVDGRYLGDVKHGVWREWTAEGVLTLEQTWKHGVLDGTVKKYVDGKLATESSYRDGKAHGSYVEYRAGKPAVTGQFDDDQRTGTWTHHDADGRIVMTANYRSGVLDGRWQQLIDGVVLEGMVTQGRRTGIWTTTDKAGAVRQLTYPAL